MGHCSFGLHRIITSSKQAIIISSLTIMGRIFKCVLGLPFDVLAACTFVKQFDILLPLLFHCILLIQKKSWPCLLVGFFSIPCVHVIFPDRQWVCPQQGTRSACPQVTFPKLFHLHSSKTVEKHLWQEILETLNLVLPLHKSLQHLLLRCQLWIVKCYKAGIDVSVTLGRCCCTLVLEQ